MCIKPHKALPLQDPYDFDCSASSPLKAFSRSTPAGSLKGSARKKTANMAGVLRTVRQSVLSPAAFTDSDSDSVGIADD